ncbi:MAG: hypothetical protein GXY83_07390 [Rhodopirellula sp.]|nr:hypothetical protein [Rhodopirellula sp.]
MTSGDDILDRLLIVTDPNAPPVDLDDVLAEFALRFVRRTHATSVDASTADESINTEAD